MMATKDPVHRILLWIGYMLIIIVGIPLYCLAEGAGPSSDISGTLICFFAGTIMFVAYFYRRRQQRKQ
ncbi:MAG TPA: hypothetical protein VFE58_17225 [Tepidisphaeraceae bacterium]|nr:hypothetical protein [Tepidisphaeraceae bacterium]